MGDEVIDRLDRLIGLIEMAHSETIQASRREVRTDAVVAAILDATEDWQASGSVKSSVASALNTSEKTVQRRIAELVDRRLLKAEGAGASRRIKSSGLA